MTVVIYGGYPYNNNVVAASRRNLLPVMGVSLLPLLVMLIGG